MQFYTEHFDGAARRVAELKDGVVGDGSLSTFAFYWSAGTKVHRWEVVGRLGRLDREGGGGGHSTVTR